ncbi:MULTISPECIES: LysR substrate-binding domain-containing protein [Caballeronia]|uniref:LysR substrate-binding domain-containing protein n=1 Tax=Caballeronia TaxID=1827195 RepID=UPI001FD29476|nr:MULTISPECIES: LysR substrate-binding domain-containing protein [Caballeronia]MDR5799187.1 LysR substrate-binding domain-containing protein [Caballeronia sp. LZ001]
MRRYRIPSVGALVAFEAAARHESFTLAAKELSLTESAVSRQINGLEDSLNIQLFVRVKQRVVLTKAGRLYSSQVRDALQTLDRDTLSIVAHGSGGGYLELAVLPTFGSEWLIPRLSDFYNDRPDIRVNMGVRTNPFSFDEAHFEAAIHYGQPTWPRTTADFLFGERMIPIVSPALVADVRKPVDLLRYPLLHSTTRPEAWTHWFDVAGVEDERTTRGVRFELHSMLIRAAESGLGVALVPEFLIPAYRNEGKFVQPFDFALTSEDAYYLVYPTDLSHSAPLQGFREWILKAAKEFEQAPHSDDLRNGLLTL